MKRIPKFAERLSELMFYNDNITSDKFGGIMGFGGSTVRLWKTGRRNPALSSAIKLADYFRCTLDFLFGRSEDDKLNFIPQPVLPFYDCLISILKKHSISWYRVSKDTKISKNNIQDWREGREPLMSTLLDLANYLDISLDCLVGRNRSL